MIEVFKTVRVDTIQVVCEKNCLVIKSENKFVNVSTEKQLSIPAEYVQEFIDELNHAARELRKVSVDKDAASKVFAEMRTACDGAK